MCLIWIELRLFIIDLEDRTHTHTHTRAHSKVTTVWKCLCEKNKTNSNQKEVNSRTPSQRKWEAAGFSNQGTLGEQEVVRRRRRRGKEKEGGGRRGGGRGGGGRGFINSPSSLWVNVPASSAAAHVPSLSNLAESRTAPPGIPTERRPPSGASGAARSSRHLPPRRGGAVAY